MSSRYLRLAVDDDFYLEQFLIYSAVVGATGWVTSVFCLHLESIDRGLWRRPCLRRRVMTLVVGVASGRNGSVTNARRGLSITTIRQTAPVQSVAYMVGLVAYKPRGNESVPKIIINNSSNLSLTAISILLITNHNNFRVLLDKIASVYFIWKNVFIS